MRAGVEGSSAWVIDAPAQGGNGILLPTVTTISPPHQSAALTASPQGEAYVLCYVGVIAMAVFYISYTGLANRLPLGGKVGRPQAGSDEGVPGGFHGAGNRPTGPRWQRDSSTRRHYHIAPSSVSCADSFPPKGKPTLLGYVGIFATVVFYSEPYRICQRLPLGGKVGRPFGPGRMRADVEGSAAWVIDAPPLPWTSFDFTSLLYKNLPVSPY